MKVRPRTIVILSHLILLAGLLYQGSLLKVSEEAAASTCGAVFAPAPLRLLSI